MPELKYKRSIFACCLIFFAIFSCSITRYENASRADEEQGTDELLAETPPEPAAAPEPVMVYYEGELLNIFFHPLVAHPEIAF